MPSHVAFGSSGGPEYRTEIVQTASGHEYRNSLWRTPLRRYNITSGRRPLADIQAFANFFNARSGRLYGFLWRDWFDDKSSLQGPIHPEDQVLAPAGTSRQLFNLVKLYENNSAHSVRRILKPRRENFKLAINGELKAINQDFTLDTQVGQVQFRTPIASDARITAGFEFYVPVRFDVDALDVELISFDAGYLPSVPMVEIRLIDAGT